MDPKVRLTVDGILHWVSVMELMNRDQLTLMGRNRDRVLEAGKIGDRIALPIDESMAMTIGAHMLALSFAHIARRLKLLARVAASSGSGTAASPTVPRAVRIR